MIRLAVDGMGGDAGLVTTLPACSRFLTQQSDVHLVIVIHETYRAWLEGSAPPPPLPSDSLKAADQLKLFHQQERVTWIWATEVVHMDDSVEVALRKKKRSSMRLTLECVRDGTAEVALSAGNTGALMAIARYLLKTLDGIDRPAIATQMPNPSGSTTVLDLGANVDCTEEHLLQFALMGNALLLSSGIEKPRVGLLNIGEEVIKGNEIIKKAGLLLRQAHDAGQIQFIGNVEGNDIFKGVADLVVCDGFVGNVALKASEGVAGMIGQFMKEEFHRNLLSRCIALLAYPVLRSLKYRLDHRRYNGAALLGLRGLVFKSHGSADALAFETALHKAYQAAQHDVIGQVTTQIQAAQAWLAQPEAAFLQKH